MQDDAHKSDKTRHDLIIINGCSLISDSGSKHGRIFAPGRCRQRLVKQILRACKKKRALRQVRRHRLGKRPQCAFLLRLNDMRQMWRIIEDYSTEWGNAGCCGARREKTPRKPQVVERGGVGGIILSIHPGAIVRICIRRLIHHFDTDRDHSDNKIYCHIVCMDKERCRCIVR